MISVHSLNKWYGNKHVLKDLNLEVKKSEIFGILGPNGAGKTTLIKVLTGQTPAKGEIRVVGINPLKDPIKVRELVGIVPENESVPNYLTVEEYLYFVAKIRKLDYSAAERMIEEVDLENYRKNVCKDLSKGTKQRLMTAAAFIHKPKLLFLDEPFINLDPIYQKKIRDYIISYAKKGNTIFMATHIIELAKKICTRIGIIKNGKIIKFVNGLENLEDIFLREFEND